MNGKYRITFALIAIFAISVLSGCVGEAEKHETIVIQLEEEVINIDNRNNLASSAYDAAVAYQYQGYLGMIAPGETIVIMPGVAESWTVNEDGDEWTFTIREGAKLHDGSVIDAKTVKYSMIADLMAYYGYDNMSYAKYRFEEWYGLNVTFPESDPNGDGLVCTFSDGYFPDPMFPFDMAGQWKRFSLVPYGSHGSYEDTTAVCQAAYDEYFDNPISAGPYKFVEFSEQDYVLFERFDDWFGWGETFTASNGKDYTFPAVDDAFKFVKYRFISEKAMALVELRTGGIDVTTSRFESKASLDAINATDGYTAYQLAVLGGASMETNIQGDWPVYFGGPGNFPVSQDWFRKAVSHAINRTNIVNNVYLGVADERDTIFSDWILDNFPSIDASDYYDFDQGVTKAIEMLDAAGYTALGFPDEPDNRFGWGLYANETQVDGVNQTKGRHFVITTMDCDFCVKRALAIKKDLEQIGLYIDVELNEWGQYLDALYEGDLGATYNTTGPQPDPNFEGAHWDFTVGGFGGNYETPWDFIAYKSAALWLYYGYGNGYDFYNEEYEVAYAKATDGWGFLSLYDFDDQYPYPVPEWSDDDPQFVQACEDAGEILSNLMPEIPIVWYVDTYAFNDHLKNFIGARNSAYHVAYSYWA